MPCMTFPASPSLNETHTVGTRTWTWDGEKWNLYEIAVHTGTGGIWDLGIVTESTDGIFDFGSV